jgi:2-hydroxychromene-2-carboxylate isomerase
VLQHVWHGGAAADDPARLAALTAALAPARDPQSEAVKQALRSHTDAAIARGVFGVPTLELPPPAGGTAPRLFFGDDGLEMAAACLRGDPWFEAGWEAAANRPAAVHRPR